MKVISIVSLFALVFWLGCDSDDAPDPVGARTLYLQAADLPTLPGDYHYEGWVSIEGEDRSFGKFNTDELSQLSTLGGVRIPAGMFSTGFDLDSSAYAFVTIEPPGDTNEEPSDTRLMGGLFTGGRADLLVTNYEGLEDELIQARGAYILATPTDGPGTNETSGLWFINQTAGPNNRGLQVPIPLTGWRYEGWVYAEGAVLSTGPIDHHSRDDLAAPYSGSGPTLGFPGEDFLFNPPPRVNFPLRLGGLRIFVTLEPSPDPDPETPSTIVLFAGRIPGEPVADSTYYLDLDLQGLPTATATISSGNQ